MTKIKKQVIYLITSPLSKRDYSRFGINRWLDRGWNVKVFDFTKFLKHEYWDYVDGESQSVDFEGLTIFEDIKSAIDSLENQEDGTVFIDIVSSSEAEQKIGLGHHGEAPVANWNKTDSGAN